MQAADLIELVGTMGVLKGFPRHDAEMLVQIAQELLRIVRPNKNPPPDSVLYQRAEAIVRRVIAIAPGGWEGPSQLYAASAKLAEEAEKWETPAEWKQIKRGVDCAKCGDTGAVQPNPGAPFVCCDCAAGETADEHCGQLNRVMRESRLRAAEARQRQLSRSNRVNESTFARIREAIQHDL